MVKNGIIVQAAYKILRNSVPPEIYVQINYTVDDAKYSKKMNITKYKIHEDSYLRLLVLPNNHKKFLVLTPDMEI